MQKIDCLEFRDARMERLKEMVQLMDKKPSLLIIKVGNDQASNKYVDNKIKRCKEVGIKTVLLTLDEDSTQSDIISAISLHQSTYNAVIVQEPLPKHIDSKEVNSYIHKLYFLGR